MKLTNRIPSLYILQFICIQFIKCNNDKSKSNFKYTDQGNQF